MSNPHQTENQNLMATIGASFLFIYIWLGLFGLLYVFYKAGFFGKGLSGNIVAALVCIFFATPILPGLISRFLIQPLFRNLLGKEIISTSGCITALITMILAVIGILYFLSRDIWVSLYFFLGAPVLGALLMLAVSLLGRTTFLQRTGRRR